MSIGFSCRSSLYRRPASYRFHCCCRRRRFCDTTNNIHRPRYTILHRRQTFHAISLRCNEGAILTGNVCDVCRPSIHHPTHKRPARNKKCPTTSPFEKSIRHFPLYPSRQTEVSRLFGCFGEDRQFTRNQGVVLEKSRFLLLLPLVPC